MYNVCLSPPLKRGYMCTLVHVSKKIAEKIKTFSLSRATPIHLHLTPLTWPYHSLPEEIFSQQSLPHLHGTHRIRQQVTCIRLHRSVQCTWYLNVKLKLQSILQWTFTSQEAWLNQCCHGNCSLDCILYLAEWELQCWVSTCLKRKVNIHKTSQTHTCRHNSSRLS